MSKKGWLQPVKRRKCRTTDSLHPYPRFPNLVKDLAVVYPDQVWAADITYIRLQRDFVYLAVVLDIFTRSVRGWCLSRLIDQDLTLEALHMALQAGVPEIHHSDQGVQYAALAYVDLLKEHNIQISMAAVGQAEENGYAERLIRTIKEEEVDLSEYLDFQDAQEQIGHFIEQVYNRKRIHSALGYLTPVEFSLAYRLAQTQLGHEAPSQRLKKCPVYWVHHNGSTRDRVHHIFALLPISLPLSLSTPNPTPNSSNFAKCYLTPWNDKHLPINATLRTNNPIYSPLCSPKQHLQSSVHCDKRNQLIQC
jgi:putative transposase